VHSPDWGGAWVPVLDAAAAKASTGADRLWPVFLDRNSLTAVVTSSKAPYPQVTEARRCLLQRSRSSKRWSAGVWHATGMLAPHILLQLVVKARRSTAWPCGVQARSDCGKELHICHHRYTVSSRFLATKKRQIYLRCLKGTTRPTQRWGSLGAWAGCGHITT